MSFQNSEDEQDEYDSKLSKTMEVGFLIWFNNFGQKKIFISLCSLLYFKKNYIDVLLFFLPEETIYLHNFER